MSASPLMLQRLHRLPPVGGAPAFEASDPATGRRAVILPLPSGPVLNEAIMRFGECTRLERDPSRPRRTEVSASELRAFVAPGGGGGIVLPWEPAETLFSLVRTWTREQVIDSMCELLDSKWSAAAVLSGEVHSEAFAPWTLLRHDDEWLPVGLFVDGPLQALWSLSLEALASFDGDAREHASRAPSRASVARVAVWAIAVSTLPPKARTDEALEVLWRSGPIDSPSGMACLVEASKLSGAAASALAEWSKLYDANRLSPSDPSTTLRDASAGKAPKRRFAVGDVLILANPKGSWYDSGLNQERPDLTDASVPSPEVAPPFDPDSPNEAPSAEVDISAAPATTPLPVANGGRSESLLETLRRRFFTSS